MKTYGESRFKGLDPYPSYNHEMALTAGLLSLYGLINLVPGMYDIVPPTIDGQDWSGDSDEYPPVVLHLAALIQIGFSLTSLAVGYQWLVSGANCKSRTLMSALFSLLSLFTFVVMISYISFESAKKQFVPFIYDSQSSTTEKRAIATLGVLGYIAYAGNNFGAIVHFNFKMLSFQSEKWARYNRSYYRKMLMFFGFFTFLAGVVQLALGAYIYDKVAEQRLSDPVHASPYVVTYPEISMTVGVFQLLLSFYIFVRAVKVPDEANVSKGLAMFQHYAWFVLLLCIAAQVLAQLTFASTEDIKYDQTAGMAAVQAALIVGLSLFPIYLDSMYYTTPANVSGGFFHSSVAADKNVSDEERKVEATPVAPAAGVADKSAV